MRKEWALVSPSMRSGGARSHQMHRNISRIGQETVRKDVPEPLKGSDSILFLCGFSCFLAVLSHLSPHSLYHSSACGIAPPQRPVCRGPGEQLWGEGKGNCATRTPIGPGRGKTISGDTGVSVQSREGACSGKQTSACDLRVYYQARQAKVRKTLDRLEKKCFPNYLLATHFCTQAESSDTQAYTHTTHTLMYFYVK